ncbi:MAG: hypothetical protein ACRENE_29405 [Polyangiaceae bacterium]
MARLPLVTILRFLLVALLAIGGATWALVRHRTYVPQPMEVPVAPAPAPAPAPTFDADAGELPVPPLEPGGE